MNIKTAISVLLIVFIMAMGILVDFLRANLGLVTSLEYWIQTLSMQIPVIVIMLAARSIGKDNEIRKNKEYEDTKKIMDDAYVNIHTNTRKLPAFREYIDADNRQRKKDAFLIRVNQKKLKVETKLAAIRSFAQVQAEKLVAKSEKKTLLKGRNFSCKQRNPFTLLRLTINAQRERRLERRLKLLNSYIDNADKIIVFKRVKYSQVSYATLFTDSAIRYLDEYDLRIHDARNINSMLVWKAVGIAAMGTLFGMFVAFEIVGDPWVIVYKAISKFVQMILGLATGMREGINFVRTEIVLRMKLRVAYVQKFLVVSGFTLEKKLNEESIELKQTKTFGERLGNISVQPQHIANS